jgi:hypothetical protein
MKSIEILHYKCVPVQGLKRFLPLLVVALSLLFLSGCKKHNNSVQSWKTLTSMPTARHHLGFVECNGLLYAIGGYNASGLNKV